MPVPMTPQWVFRCTEPGCTATTTVSSPIGGRGPHEMPSMLPPDGWWLRSVKASTNPNATPDQLISPTFNGDLYYFVWCPEHSRPYLKWLKDVQDWDRARRNHITKVSRQKSTLLGKTLVFVLNYGELDVAKKWIRENPKPLPPWHQDYKHV